MATTTYFGWETPDDTDLVKDGAAAIRTLGSAIDSSMSQLEGGTTGQILSKTSATDMAFTWINNDQGDITAVTAGTGISGGGTSGAVTVTNSMATAITTAGDLIKGTGSGTFDRLGIGTTGQVLTVASGAPAWATPAASGGKTLLSTTALSGTSTTVSSISGSYTDLYVYVLAHPSTSAIVGFTFNSYSAWLGYYVRGGNSGTPGVSDTNGASTLTSISTFDNSAGGAFDVLLPQYTTSGAGKYKMAQYNFLNSNGTTLSGVAWASSGSPTAAATSFTVSSTQSLTGTILVYGIS
jgi:hypothetical protein